MPNLAASVLRHFRRLKNSNGVLASITRGEVTLNDVTIVLGRCDSEALSSREVTAAADSQDILAEIADYGFDPREPQAGDVFAYQQAGQTVTAEAMPVSETLPCFRRWQGGQVVRVNCKITKRE